MRPHLFGDAGIVNVPEVHPFRHLVHVAWRRKGLAVRLLDGGVRLKQMRLRRGCV